MQIAEQRKEVYDKLPVEMRKLKPLGDADRRIVRNMLSKIRLHSLTDRGGTFPSIVSTKKEKMKNQSRAGVGRIHRREDAAEELSVPRSQKGVSARVPSCSSPLCRRSTGSMLAESLLVS